MAKPRAQDYLKKPLIQFLLFLVITSIVFALLFRSIDIRDLWITLRGGNSLYISLAFLVMFSFPTSIAWRWKYLLEMLGYHVSFRDCLKIVLGTWPLMSITPLKSGDLLKAYYLKDRIPVGIAIGSVMAEKLFDVYSLLFFSIVGAAFISETRIVLVSVVVFVLITAAILFLGLMKNPTFGPIGRKVSSLISCIRILLKEPRKLAYIFFYSVIKWLLVIFQAFLCFMAFKTEIPVLYMVAAFPIAIFVGLLPVTLTGMGTRDAAIVYLFSSFAPPEVCITVGLLYALFGYWLPSLIGLPVFKQLARVQHSVA